MASVNKVIIIGNLGRDPEMRYTADGAAICSLNIATTLTWRDRQSGENREDTEWHRVVLFRRLAEVAGQYLKKGRPVYIEGRLKTRKWQDKDGIDRYTTEIIGDQMQMLGGRNDAGTADMPDDGGRFDSYGGGSSNNDGGFETAGQNNYGNKSRPSSPRTNAPDIADIDDDIPF